MMDITEDLIDHLLSLHNSYKQCHMVIQISMAKTMEENN